MVLSKETAPLRACLRECLEYLEKHYDVKDSPSGPVPNEAMRLGSEIKYVLGFEP